MREQFDGELVREWADQAESAFGATRAEIDALNVFPVPDGDTGTNLFLTIESAANAVFDAMRAADLSGAQALDAFAGGALLGARGNSGVITSQILRGIADEFGDESGQRQPAQVLAAALKRASALADQAVAQPKEGTVLTVARESANALIAAVDASTTLAGAVEVALTAAQEALARTPEQLPVLKEAGVVDSGGRGFVVLLEALSDSITGVRREREPVRIERSGAMDVATHAVSYGGPAYEVMYLLEAQDEQVPALRSTLDSLGDSLVVVGGGGLWNVHVHTDDIGAAIEAGIVAGRPYRIKVTHLELADGARRLGEGGSEPRSGRGIVAVSHGPGVAALLMESGVTTVAGKPGRRPSTAELLDGIHRANASEVVLLPSDGDTRIVAEAAAEQARNDGIRTAVIPTRSIVQSLAAVAVHQPGALFDDDIVAMGRAAGSTRYGAITTAVRKAMTSAGVCEVGDALGLVGGDIVEIAPDLPAAALAVVDRLVGADAELLTVIGGEDGSTELIETVTSHVEAHYPEVDVDVIAGGQPLWPLIFGAE